MSVRKQTTDQTKKEFLEILARNKGIISHACKEMGISRTTVRTWRMDEEFAGLMDDTQELTLELVEDALKENIKALDTSSILFYLKKKGKEKGYGEGSLADYLRLPGWKESKTPQERLAIINLALADGKISIAQAASLSTHVANEVNVELKIDELARDVAMIKKLLEGNNHALGN